MKNTNFAAGFADMATRSALAIAEFLSGTNRKVEVGNHDSAAPVVRKTATANVEDAQPILIVENIAEDALSLSQAVRDAHFINPLISLPDSQSVELYLGGVGVYANRKKYPFPALVLQDVTWPKLDGLTALPWLEEGLVWREIIIMDLSGHVEPEHFESAVALGPGVILCRLQHADSMAAMFRVLQRACIED